MVETPIDTQDQTTLYFAYGSNMSTSRLQKRVSSACPMSIARLADWRLAFNKQSKDGSAKCNIEPAVGSMVWGVLYTIERTSLDQLDRAEDGYERMFCSIKTPLGQKLQAVTYISHQITADQVSYDWYKMLVLTGAREHNLPADYITTIERIPSKTDVRQEFKAHQRRDKEGKG